MAVHALGQLIEDTMQLHTPPLGVREVARRAELTPAHISRLLNHPIKTLPDPATLRKLSKALQVPLSAVVDAGLHSLGLSRVETDDPEFLMIRAGVSELPPGEKERLIKMFMSMLEVSREQS